MNDWSAAFATPDDDIVMLAGTTLSWLSAPDSAYPAAKGKDGSPGSVTKSLQANDTLRSTHTNVALVGAAMFYTNAETITLSDTGGSIGSMDPLARDGDNHTHNPFLSFASRSSTQFNFAMNKVGTTHKLWVGEIRLIKAWREFKLAQPLKKRVVEYGPPDERTFLGSALEWPQDIRWWVWEGNVFRDSEVDAMFDLYYRSRILRRPFVFVERWDVRKAYLVRFSESTLELSQDDGNKVTIPIRLEEVVAGIPPPSA